MKPSRRQFPPAPQPLSSRKRLSAGPALASAPFDTTCTTARVRHGLPGADRVQVNGTTRLRMRALAGTGLAVQTTSARRRAIGRQDGLATPHTIDELTHGGHGNAPSLAVLRTTHPRITLAQTMGKALARTDARARGAEAKHLLRHALVEPSGPSTGVARRQSGRVIPSPSDTTQSRGAVGHRLNSGACQPHLKRLNRPIRNVLRQPWITTEAALIAIPATHACAGFRNGRHSRRLPGFIADFVVLDRNPTLTLPRKLSGTLVLRAHANGHCFAAAPPS